MDTGLKIYFSSCIIILIILFMALIGIATGVIKDPKPKIIYVQVVNSEAIKQ